MRKQPEITEQTKQNILDAFWSLYAKRRIDQITVKEIAALAGYNRGTFYEYFHDVHACLERIEAQSLPKFEELPPVGGDASLLPGFIESFAGFYRSKFKYYDVLLGVRGDPSFQRKLIDTIKAAVLDNFSGKSSVDKVELDLFLEYSISGLISIMRYYSHLKPKRTIEDFVKTVHRLMGDGFSVLMGARMP